MGKQVTQIFEAHGLQRIVGITQDIDGRTIIATDREVYEVAEAMQRAPLEPVPNVFRNQLIVDALASRDQAIADRDLWKRKHDALELEHVRASEQVKRAAYANGYVTAATRAGAYVRNYAPARMKNMLQLTDTLVNSIATYIESMLP